MNARRDSKPDFGNRRPERFFSIAVIAIALACGSCDTTSYKTALSTAPSVKRALAVDKHVAVAQNSADNAQAKRDEMELRARAATITVKTTADHIDAAMADLAVHNYAAAAAHLNSAKVGHGVVMSFLEETLRSLQSQGRDLRSVKDELGKAQGQIVEMQGELEALQEELDEQTLEGADDHVIAVRCKSWFGLGALFYGVEHMLKAGILGILILVGVALVVIVIGYFVGGPIGAVVMNVGGRLRKKTS